MHLKTYKEKVHHILKTHENARNHDGSLVAHYVNTFHHNLVIKDSDGDAAIKLRNLKSMPSIESIIRSRRLVQNDDGEFIPTIPAVIKARQIKEKNYREAEVREARGYKVESVEYDGSCRNIEHPKPCRLKGKQLCQSCARSTCTANFAYHLCAQKSLL